MTIKEIAMKFTRLTQQTLSSLAATAFLLLMPVLVNTVMLEPVAAQEKDENGENGEAPVNGVDAGAGGAYQNEADSALPIAIVGGVLLVGAGILGYRYSRKNAAQ
jgi:hypothetical protein